MKKPLFKIRAEVNTRMPAIHRCPEHICTDPDNAFLAAPHRHEFHITVRVHLAGDRSVEFLLLKRDLEGLLSRWRNQNIGTTSCESLCAQIAQALTNQGYAVSEVLVSEDGENGALLEVERVVEIEL